MRRVKIVSMLLSLLLITASCTEEKKKVLIIGDSISLGYTPFVQKKLEAVADVFHHPGNAKHTGNGIELVESWIGDSIDWDIIHFNWGLWDLCYRHPDSKVQGNRDKVNGTITFTLDEYVSNLETIIRKIKTKSDAKLIFVTTTYVPENEAGRFQEDALRYNEAATRIMKENGIVVHDIFQKSKAIHDLHGKGSDDVHYTEAGSELLGAEISTFLLEEMN